MSEEEDDFEIEGEILPDLPAVIHTLEQLGQEWQEISDLDKVTKRELAGFIGNMMDCLVDLSKYVLAKAYTIDILDRAVAHIGTMYVSQSDDDEPDPEIEKFLKDRETAMYS